MSQITLAKTISLTQAWMAKDEAIVFFGFQNHKPTFQVLLKKFKEHKDYKDGYRLVTPNVPIINVQKFDEFLLWHEKNKYRRNKE
ncbi:hypothetical protein IGK80_002382 [Enterococcus sp. DIV0609]|uniref:hypothetical protein n=1 Tax=Enterococcus TaxID=1350 RepID=UPI000371012D|nr:hypothetical protein [Enterococcus faecalis]EGO7969834.1 hypothetical protein [Enterococcus faecalis]EGO8308808.1 hypothetical protein [Enterococcus faecalis]EIP8062076.1 hypothetical protein [Enterococcus faecalis]EKZ0111043.1 hypothetical protein [Enterococcus faecalis]ELT8936930.1 hypothetical protein [Enterococcus faecalis]